MKEQKFYPNIPYNKSKRTKFFTLMGLLIVSMGLVAGLMVSLKQIPFAVIFGVLALMFLVLIPSALKSHPIKPDVPEIVVNGKDITLQNKTFKSVDIDKVLVTITLSPISKIDSENKQYVLDMASTHPQEPMLGSVDVYLKKSPKIKRSEEVIYTTVDDCIGAATAIVNAGVKHYGIFFNLKKTTEKAKFTLQKTVEEKHESLSDVSKRDRLKQLI